MLILSEQQEKCCLPFRIRLFTDMIWILGKPLDNISALTEQIQSDEQDVNWTTTSSFPLMFLKGDEDNSLFYIDHTGVYDMFWEAA